MSLSHDPLKGDYFRFLREALDRKDDENVLFLRYEEARKDRRQFVLDIAKFLGDRHYDKLIANNEKMLGLVLEHSSIESMKENPRRWCSEYLRLCVSASSSTMTRIIETIQVQGMDLSLSFVQAKQAVGES